MGFFNNIFNQKHEDVYTLFAKKLIEENYITHDGLNCLIFDFGCGYKLESITYNGDRIYGVTGFDTSETREDAVKYVCIALCNLLDVKYYVSFTEKVDTRVSSRPMRTNIKYFVVQEEQYTHYMKMRQDEIKQKKSIRKI